MSSFAQSYQHQCLLNISRRHRDSVDPDRIFTDNVAGQDNWDNLDVSTVFAAIAIEASLNDYVLSHCLFVEGRYLQGIFGEVAKNYLRGSVHNKIDLLKKHWPDLLPKELLKDIQELIRIRNSIAHQTGEFRAEHQAADQCGQMTNCSMPAKDRLHMLRHYEIALDFLSRFWLPGNRELQHGLVTPEMS